MTMLRSEWAWRKVRNEHFDLEPMCQLCGTDEDCQVHHILPWHKYKDLRYEHDNLVTLCREHHFRFAHLGNWQRYCPDILDLCVLAQSMNPYVKWAGRVEEPRALPLPQG